MQEPGRQSTKQKPEAPPRTNWRAKYRLRWVIVVCVAGVFAGLWMKWLSDGGVRMSSDSAWYCVTALRMHTLGDFDLRPTWPPLYPLMLDAAMYLSPFPLDAAAWISAASMFVVIVGLSCLLHACRLPWWLEWPAIAAVITLPSFLTLFTSAWSEQPFAALLVLHFWFLLRYFQRGRVGDLAWASAAVALAMLARYAAYAVMGSFTLLMALEMWRSRRRLMLAAIWCMAWMPVAAYLLRNWLRWRTPHGPRQPPLYPFFQGLRIHAGEMFVNLWNDLPGIVWVLLGLAVAGIVIGRRSMRDGDSSGVWRLTAYIAVLSVIYQALLVYSMSRIDLGSLISHYTSSGYMPLILAAVLASYLGLQAAAMRGGFNRLAAPMAGAVVTVLLVMIVVMQGSSVPAVRRSMYPPARAQLHHRHAGFNQSASAAAIRKYLHELTQAGERNVVVVFDDPPVADMLHFNRALFYRGALFEWEGVRSARPVATQRCTGNEPWTDEKYGDVVVEIEEAGRTARIVLRDIPEATTSQDLAAATRRITAEEEAALTAFIYRDGRLEARRIVPPPR